MKKIALYTLGCKVNQYETQALKEIFENNGYEIVDDFQFADVYVVNSCSVTGTADRKTRQYLNRSKKRNPEAITVLIGCYAETGMEQIEEMDNVDIVLGTAEKPRLFEEVEARMASHKDSSPESKIIKVGGVNDSPVYDDYGLVTGMDSRTRAYIKIEDGCDRFCSYCVIPFARGAVRSRPVDSILQEAENLISKGYKELILTGINAALYGRDMEDMDLIRLLKMIGELKGEFRIRLSSLEPTVINAAYAEKLVQIDKLCPHLHLSLQSGSDKILKAMNRDYTREDYLAIVDVLKSYDPHYSISTDIIVGFPGEDYKDFADSMNMVRKVKFSKVHVFPFSKRPGTAAADMKNQVDDKTKKRRGEELLSLADKKATEFMKRNGLYMREALILEHDEDKDLYRGITDNNITVSVKSDTDITNTFMKVKL